MSKGLPQKPQAALQDKFSVLRQHPLFRELNAEALDQLCRYAKSRAVKRGTIIFSKGDPGNSLYAVVKGAFRIGVTSAAGREAVFNIVTPGEIFGEIALLDGGERTADAVAHTDEQIRKWPGVGLHHVTGAR